MKKEKWEVFAVSYYRNSAHRTVIFSLYQLLLYVSAVLGLMYYSVGYFWGTGKA